jgi:hypothetical protein
MNGRSRLVMWVGLLALLVSFSVTSAQAETIENYRIEYVSGATNTCTGERIETEIRLHTHTSRVIDKDGVQHFKRHINLHGTGTALITGTRYIINEVSHVESHVASGQRDVYTTLRSVIVSQGPSDNEQYLLTMEVHFAVGRPPVIVREVEINCR